VHYEWMSAIEERLRAEADETGSITFTPGGRAGG
jgi:hypothetical protein